MRTLGLRAPCPAAAKTASGRPLCSRLVCMASATPEDTSRRAVLGAVLGVGSVLALPLQNAYAGPPELEDARKVKDFMDSIRQAANAEEDQRKRFSLTELKGLTIDDHKRRLTASVKGLQSKLEPALERNTWWRVRNSIRDYGTIRYDLDRLTAAVGDRASRKQLQADQELAMRALDRLDLAARKEDAATAKAAYEEAKSKLQGLASALA